MSVAMSILLGIGRVVASIALRGAVRNDAISGELAQVLSGAVEGVLERRRAARQLDEAADYIAEHMEAFIGVEFAGLPDNELTATVLTVQETLQAASIDGPLLATLDLEAQRLEEHVMAFSTDILERAVLATDAQELYRRLITECCHYITELASALPKTEQAVYSELLKRDRTLSELVQQVLKLLPSQGFAPDSRDRDFEVRYRRSVASTFDQLELFGVSGIQSSRRYALSVAYITLSAASTVAAAKGDVVYARVDEAIADQRIVLIKGEAGSGKTTLLQWLAVQTARSALGGALEPWNACVPFFVRMRRYAEDDLPSPDQMVRAMSASLADVVPTGWAARQFNSARALLLVDGLDELPEHRRVDVRNWLEDLLVAYPDFKCVITSRPPAVQDGWLQVERLHETELQPMSLLDIVTFVDHWHEAATKAAGEAAAEEMESYNTALKQLIREQPSLRALATLPLLCALICALHRERRRKLPKNRMDLYRIALEMLIDRRDVERDIPTDDSLHLAYTEKVAILGDVALRFLLSGLAEASRAQVVSWISLKLDSMPGVSAGAEEVYKHLLLRSGLLREPVEGRADFIHKTFLEYLAAGEALAQGHLPVLVANAHLDSWREVVILAAGHARAGERTELIQGLMERADSESGYRHVLDVVAVACMETSAEIEPAVQERLTERLRQVIPPSNMTDAKAVAAAGDLAVPLLAVHRDASVGVAAACVRALATIGTEKAMSALAGYGPDQRVTVARELLRAWSDFDPEAYAQAVLAESLLDWNAVTINQKELLPGIRHLKNLKTLNCRLRDVANLEDFDGVTAQARIWVSASPHLTDVTPLQALDLTTLSIQGTSVAHVDVAVHWPNLREIHLRQSPIAAIDVLADHESLAVVMISGCPLDSLDPLGTLPNVVIMTLDGAPHASATGLLSGLQAAGSFESLKILDLESESAIVPGSTLLSGPILEMLSLRNAAIHDLGFMGACPTLETLTLVDCPSLEALAGGSDLPTLRELRITGCRSLTDIGALSQWPSLHEVHLGGSPSIRSIAPLLDLPRLKVAVISGCGELEDLALIRDMPDVTWIVDFDQADALSQTGPVPKRIFARHSETPVGASEVLWLHDGEVVVLGMPGRFWHRTAPLYHLDDWSS